MTPAQTEVRGALSFWRAAYRLRQFIAPHKVSLAVSFFLLLGSAGAKLLIPWPLKFIFDDILGKRALEGTTLYLLVGVLALVIGAATFDGFFRYFQVSLLNRAGRTIVFELRTALFDHMQRVSLGYHSRRATGDVMTRFTGDVKAFKKVFTEDIAELVVNALFLVGMFSILFWLDWQLALIVAAATPVLGIAMVHYVFQVREFSKAERKREGNLASVLHETLATVRLSHLFSREDDARQKFAAESAASLESGLSATLAEERFSWLMDVLAALVTVLVIAFGVQRAMAGSLSPGSLIVFVLYVNGMFKPLRTVIKAVNSIAKASPRVERVVELLDVEEGVRDLPDARPAPRFRGAIEFRGVTFEHEPNRPVLEGIDLTIPAGRVAALVGPTGAGKSTLASLIPRLYDPKQGAVLIDGRDVRAYTLQSLRTQISVVLQETVLLRASIAENIAYGRPSASFADIVAAAKAANAHEFIAELPEGYEAEVGERGETLSGGQRQRIAIARAMIRDAPILVLDEPLTGLDAVSAAAVVEALERLIRGKTVVMITHHLPIAKRADRVVVMAEGRVAQQGTSDELLHVPGPYRELFEAGLDGDGAAPGDGFRPGVPPLTLPELKLPELTRSRQRGDGR